MTDLHRSIMHVTSNLPDRGVLDCSRAGNFVFWLLSGAIVVLMAQAVYVNSLGGNWAYLIRVGSKATLRPLIVAELGEIEPTDELGHDGQMCYAIARDPWDQRGTSELIRHVDPQYRYRRILYPLLSGGFGTWSPRWTLYGLIVWLAIGAGLTSVACADLAYQRRLPGGAVLASIIHPGMLTSAVALTPDALALGLAMAGVALYARRHTGWAIAFLSFATLTKETHLLFAAGIALDAWSQNRRRDALLSLTLPLAAFAAWSGWCWRHVVHGTSPMHNFTVPGAGMVDAIHQWVTVDSTVSSLALDFAVGGLGLVWIVLALGTAVRSSNRLITVCCVLWALMALTTSISVWGEPTNLIRIAAPLWPLVCLNVAEVLVHPATERVPHGTA